jgi:hypothetical protein
MDCFCLTPLKPDDQCWADYSEIRGKRVWTWARDCTQARDIVAHALGGVVVSAAPAPTGRYEKIDFQRKSSPWKRSDVTSCERDNSNCPPPDFVLIEGGETRPCKYN